MWGLTSVERRIIHRNMLIIVGIALLFALALILWIQNAEAREFDVNGVPWPVEETSKIKKAEKSTRPEWVQRKINTGDVVGWGYISFDYPHAAVEESYGSYGEPFKVLMPWVVYYVRKDEQYRLAYCKLAVTEAENWFFSPLDLFFPNDVLGPYNLTLNVLLSIENVEVFDVQEWASDIIPPLQ